MNKYLFLIFLILPFALSSCTDTYIFGEMNVSNSYNVTNVSEFYNVSETYNYNITNITYVDGIENESDPFYFSNPLNFSNHSNVVVSDTAPSSAIEDDLWIQNNNETIYGALYPFNYDSSTAWNPASNTMSGDGNILLISSGNSTNQGNRTFISLDSGKTWSEKDLPGITYVESFGISYNGSVIFSSIYEHGIFLSTDYGDSWSEVQPTGVSGYDASTISLSYDGSVVLMGMSTINRLYLSTDTGSTWSEVRPAGDVDKYWTSSSMSSDGSIILVDDVYGRLYLSTDTGSSWSEVRPAGDADFAWGVSMSSDGSDLFAAARTGRVYLSEDTGSTWSEVQPRGDMISLWSRTDISADGNTLLAYISGNKIYISNDKGTTWSVLDYPANDFPSSFTNVEMSADGDFITFAKRPSTNNAFLYWRHVYSPNIYIYKESEWLDFYSATSNYGAYDAINEDIYNIKTATFEQEVLQRLGTTSTIDWNEGSMFVCTAGLASTTLTFVDPINVGRFDMRIVRTSSDAFTGITFPSNVIWLGDEPDWSSMTLGDEVIITFRFDSEGDYLAMASPIFSR